MITRCYSEVEHKRSPRYKDCTVVEEWHNFQNFAAWYGQNYYEVDGETMSLDKDILYKGNKVYSPETCVFVPNRINMLFVKRNASRGELPIGVTSCKRDKKYQTHCNSLGVLGRYDTIEEAFSVYKVNKEKLIKQIANDYSDKIPKRLYDTMVNYKVEVTD